MEAIKNVKIIEVSDTTREFLTIKAELSAVYNHLAMALNKVDERCDNPNTKILKDSFLDADTELLHYIAELIDEKMLTTGFKEL